MNPVSRFWCIPGIGDFSTWRVAKVLGISNEIVNCEKKRFQKRGKLRYVWRNLLWLMAYDEEWLRIITHNIYDKQIPVRFVRENILGLSSGEFAVLLGVKHNYIEQLEYSERRRGCGHLEQLNMILVLLSTKEYQQTTIKRLLHQARKLAETNLEHKRVDKLRSLLIQPKELI